MSTRLGANNGGIAKWVIPLLSIFFRTPDQGAQTSIYLCSEPRIEAPNGTYFVNKRPAKVSTLARDSDIARQLFVESEKLVGLEGSACWG